MTYLGLSKDALLRILCTVVYCKYTRIEGLISDYVKVKVAQSCLTLCDPMDYIVLGILQARILGWVAFPFSRGSSQSRD